MTRKEAVQAILEELAFAENKFPTWPDDKIHAAAVVAEESGELVQAALQYVYEGGTEDHMKKEAIQTGAMAVRFLINSHNLIQTDMETLKLSKSEIRKLHKDGPEWMKKKLSDDFGRAFFSTKITDRITSYEDAYEEADEDTRRECDIFPTDTHDVVDYKKLKLIARVLNEGWVPDWNNTDQYKYFPYFVVSGGFDFSDSDYDFTCTDTSVGSRLCFHSSDLAVYAGKQFTKLYQDFLITK